MAAELTDERAAFEAWFTKPGDYEPEWLHGRQTRAGWLYSNADTENFWQAWQARAALATQQATQGAEPVAVVGKGAGGGVGVTYLPGLYSLPIGTRLYTAHPPTAEVEKKAARYDWLRALPLFGAWDVTRVRPNREWLIDSLRADDLDAAIDAALSKESANGLE